MMSPFSLSGSLSLQELMGVMAILGLPVYYKWRAGELAPTVLLEYGDRKVSRYQLSSPNVNGCGLTMDLV
jgi:hypothetical protein